MVAKLIVHGVDREHARRRMLRALEEFEIGGVDDAGRLPRALLSHPCFVAGETCHGVVESEELRASEAEAVVSSATTSRRVGRTGTSTRRHAGRAGRPAVRGDGAREPEPRVRRARAPRGGSAQRGARRAARPDAVVSPMQGTVLEVRVADGDEVEAGAVICIVEAMKMENELPAHRAGVVAELSVAAGPAGRGRPDDLRRSSAAESRPAGDPAARLAARRGRGEPSGMETRCWTTALRVAERSTLDRAPASRRERRP